MKSPAGRGSSGRLRPARPRSYSSASVMRTRTLSPGFSSSLSTNTLPSISGASAQERPTAPCSSTSSISTSISLPTLSCRRAAEIACWWAMKRSQRSCLTSSGTGSRPSSLAGAPSTGEYWKQPTRSSWASVSQSSRYWKSSSVSPGKPTMKVERMVSSGQISRHCLIRARVLSSKAGRFMALSTFGLACWKGMSRYGRSLPAAISGITSSTLGYG